MFRPYAFSIIRLHMRTYKICSVVRMSYVFVLGLVVILVKS